MTWGSVEVSEWDGVEVSKWDGVGVSKWDGVGVSKWDGVGVSKWDGVGVSKWDGVEVSKWDGVSASLHLCRHRVYKRTQEYFVNRSPSVKFAEIFSHKNFLLYVNFLYHFLVNG